MDVMDELCVDGFAGGGGASTGIELALGRHVDHAMNHDENALGMHRINHPQTIHHCEDIFDVNPRHLTEGRRVGMGWFSPDCRHFSKAKGGKPLSKKIRGLAFVIFRWADIRTRVIYMENVEEIQTWGPLLPNGKADPKHKGRTFQAFIDVLGNGIPADHPDIEEMLAVLKDEKGDNSITREQLVRGFGYHVERRELRACNYGVPTIRKRLFLIARCDGMPIVWPAPTHAAPELAKSLKLKPWRTIAECIDWSIPCNSIFLTKQEARLAKCKRPLANATLRRIAKGVDRYVLKAARPFIVSLTHQGGDTRVESVDEPTKVITGAQRGEKAFVDASLAPFIEEESNASNERVMPADEPMRTLCAQVKGGHFGLAAANLVKFRGNPETHGKAPDMNEPAHTVSAGGQHHGLVAASLTQFHSSHKGAHDGDNRNHSLEKQLPTQDASNRFGLTTAYLAQHNGGFNTNPGHGADEPASTISGTGSQQQIVTAKLGGLNLYYGSEAEGQALDEPLRTVTAKPRFGLTEADAASSLLPHQIAGARRVAQFLREHGVQFEGEFATVCGFVIWNLAMRMLESRELFRAQGFSDEYVIDRAWLVHPKTGEIKVVNLTKTQQIRMCGNSVCPPIACALVAANSPELSAWQAGERKKYFARPMPTSQPNLVTV